MKSGRTALHVLSRQEDVIGGYRGRLLTVSCQIQLPKRAIHKYGDIARVETGQDWEDKYKSPTRLTQQLHDQIVVAMSAHCVANFEERSCRQCVVGCNVYETSSIDNVWCLRCPS